jgi:NADPH:quinone reductase-like Zn-dependent oxidoreductase
MKAIAIERFGGVDKLAVTELPQPQPASNEVLMQVLYTSVNPVDWKIREGYLKDRLPHQFPLIPGWDAAGIVSGVGKNVKGFKIADEVFAYCRKPIVQWGTYAEYVAFDAENVAHKPKNISFAQAAAIPLVGLTAWQALFDAAKLKKGEKILIHAGAGGVGSMAIQFAKFAGAYVLTTASSSNHAYVKKLGADIAIDYNQGFVNQVKSAAPEGLDVVLDCIGGQTLRDSIALLKPKGRLISILEPVDPSLAAKHKITSSYVFVSPNGKELTEIAQLISQDKVRPPHIEEMPLEEAARAQEKNRQGHSKGKIVLKTHP